MSYDPTQPVPPPIEPTRADEPTQYTDLTPPPPPIITSELPYFNVPRRTDWTKIIIGLIIVACILLALYAEIFHPGTP